MSEPEPGGILGILRFLKDARSVVKEADLFLDDTEGIISKHQKAITEVFGEFLPEIGSRVDSTVQAVKAGDIKPVEENLIADVFEKGNMVNVIASTFTNQPEVELSEDNQSIIIHYDENKTKPIQLPCAVEYEDKYLFDWDDSDKKITQSLQNEFDVDWLDDTMPIVKTTDKIKFIYKDKQHKLSILMDETDETKATLSVNNERVFNLKLEKDKDKIKVYRDSYTFVNGVLHLLFTKKNEKREEKRELAKTKE